MANRENSKPEENGYERQERIQREQHRPEQEEGYDRAVRGPVPPSDNDLLNRLSEKPPVVSDNQGPMDIDDREADDAAMEVRRQEHSAD